MTVLLWCRLRGLSSLWRCITILPPWIDLGFGSSAYLIIFEANTPHPHLLSFLFSPLLPLLYLYRLLLLPGTFLPFLPSLNFSLKVLVFLLFSILPFDFSSLLFFYHSLESHHCIKYPSAYQTFPPTLYFTPPLFYFFLYHISHPPPPRCFIRRTGKALYACITYYISRLCFLWFFYSLFLFTSCGTCSISFPSAPISCAASWSLLHDYDASFFLVYLLVFVRIPFVHLPVRSTDIFLQYCMHTPGIPVYSSKPALPFGPCIHARMKHIFLFTPPLLRLSRRHIHDFPCACHRLPCMDFLFLLSSLGHNRVYKYLCSFLFIFFQFYCVYWP